MIDDDRSMMIDIIDNLTSRDESLFNITRERITSARTKTVVLLPNRGSNVVSAICLQNDEITLAFQQQSMKFWRP